jgi:hypothetical protein
MPGVKVLMLVSALVETAAGRYVLMLCCVRDDKEKELLQSNTCSTARHERSMTTQEKILHQHLIH